ncbi:hypothetical protein [Roseateles asaccharophilus]|uniref:Uncharacterized protein n=1 Tax=Roseateles asaccharophilus TaxID=582607 RepID=A0ABU2AFK4_9BURK|nr:hypothetical protein [Roseateles asaccharophilus]MDR7335989.1 hypothetical protein [Roseateles asaccharophilus]
MQQGRIVETLSSDALWQGGAQHAYTQALVAAAGERRVRASFLVSNRASVIEGTLQIPEPGSLAPVAAGEPLRAIRLTSWVFPTDLTAGLHGVVAT